MSNEESHEEPAPVADFSLSDYQHRLYTLSHLMGENGLLLGFIGDVWLPANVRRLQWLQRYAPRIKNSGVGLAALISNQTHTLYNFYISSPIPLEFPLLADFDRAVHHLYHLDYRPALLLIDRHQIIREKWLVTEKHSWVDFSELLRAIARL